MEQIDSVKLGLRLKEAREKANVTQNELYERTKISTTQISAYENGKRNIGLVTIAKIAIALDISIDELVFGPISKKPINKSIDRGELIVNCISALFDEGVIKPLPHEVENEYVLSGEGLFYKIGFSNYVNLLDDMVMKLYDLEINKDAYPDPKNMRNQILAMTAKKINSLK